MAKHTIEYVKEYTENSKDTILNSKVYKNNKEKLEFQCVSKGHIYWMSFTNFQQGQRCSKCAGNKKHTIEDVREKAMMAAPDYKLLSKVYKNAREKLEWECPKNHTFWTSYDNFIKKGNRCPECAGKKKHTIEDVREKAMMAAPDYKLLSKVYVGALEKLEWECPKNHTFWASYGNFINNGTRCPFCAANATSSEGEREVGQFVESCLHHDTNIILNDRTQILNPLTDCFLELDIWISSLKKAIEYNGVYYHSLPDQKIRDKIKVEECKRLGIDLLIVNEEKWTTNQEVEKKIIEKFLTP